MGQLYSYTQPSSSSASIDITSLLEAEGQLYKDEGVSPERLEVFDGEGDDGIPPSCYCGDIPEIETSYTAKDPGRLYYTCHNAQNGDHHIWKWWDVAVTEELGEYKRQLRMLKEQVFEVDQKLVQLQKIVCKKNAENAWVGHGFVKVFCLIVSALLVFALAVIFNGRASK